MLDIENMNDNKQVYLTSKERRYKIIEKEIEPLKNVISLFKDFETLTSINLKGLDTSEITDMSSLFIFHHVCKAEGSFYL